MSHRNKLTLLTFCPTTLRLLLLAGSLIASAAVSALSLQPLEPTPEQSKATLETVEILTTRHFRDMPLDDKVASRFLDNYLESLDPAKSFFFASDIEEFEKHRYKFDDYYQTGDLDVTFDIFNRYRERVAVRLEAVIARLSNEDVEFDFTEDDTLTVDPEATQWPKDQADANILWHKRIKSGLLNLVLTGKTLPEAKETLKKRYEMQLSRLEQQNTTDAFETSLNALTVLYDPHTSYMSPQTMENFTINMSLQLQGIGAVLRTEDEYTKVDRVVVGGPAQKQGELKPLDRIIAVGQGDEGELVDVIGWRLDDVVKLIRGERDTIVRLKTLSPDNHTKVITITRDTVKLEEQAARKAVFELGDGDNIYKIGVINIPTFYHDFEAFRRRDPNARSTTRDVARLLRELEELNVDGIVLDLRNNGGGSLQEATMLTDLFIDTGTVVQIRHSNNQVDRRNQSRNSAVYRGPLVVLINRLSASASEIFAGAIQDYKRGLVVGNQTFGKGTVQSLARLSHGQLKITESKFYRVSGDSTQHRGVVPDVTYPEFIDKEAIGESAYDYALPWDQIHKAPHETYYKLDAMSPYLQSQHEKRIQKDPDFVYLMDQAELRKANNQQKEILLNKEKRIAEQNKAEKQALVIENKRRQAKGLELFDSFESFQSEEQDDIDSSLSGAEEINMEKDPVLNETGYLLLDYIRLLDNEQVQKVANF